MPAAKAARLADQFVEAHDAVDGNVLPKPHDKLLPAIRDQIILVGDAAREWHRIDLAGPAGQVMNPIERGAG